MPDLADLTDALIALIPEDGSRITNDQIQPALEQEAGEPISDDALKEIKNLVVAMGAAEGVKGPGGGLKAPGLEAPSTSRPGSKRWPAPPHQQRRQRPSRPGHHRPGHHSGLSPHRRAAQPDRSDLGCLLERRHRQPAGGAGAAHLPAVYSAAG